MIQTGNRSFYIAQFIGWGTFAFLNFITQFLSLRNAGVPGYDLGWLIMNSFIAFVGGFVLTTIYRYLLKKRSLNLLNFKLVLGYIILGTILLTCAVLLYITIVLWIKHDGRMLSLGEFLSNFFIFGVLMLIWNSLYFMIHYLHSWKNSESEKWQLEASMKDAQLGNLKAQINPHFMFNAINNIKALISEEPERAKSMLINFSDMFRYSLIKNDKSLVTITEEVDVVRKYFDLLSIQFEDKLTYVIEVEEDLEEEKVPPMMLQLLVENAIKHGISELPDGGLVEVEVTLLQERIHMIVKNTGTLNTEQSLQQKLGVGLNNIKERLRLLYGSDGVFELTQEEGKVQARIVIPKSN